MTDYENVVVTVSLYSDSSGVPGFEHLHVHES